jgi:hypothetical protein
MILLACLSLAGCDSTAEVTTARFTARKQAIDPPQLWLAQVVEPGGAVRSSAFICADTVLRETFPRARAEVNGVSCLDMGTPVVKPGLFAVRCRANGHRYGESIATTGDPTQDFRLVFAVTSLDQRAVSVRQDRRFRRVGPCPAGWRIGDQAKPGERP